ncbi:right-handed parallel beta-helix repeat-containing protein [Paenibacillus sepulcri]|uniref:Right-handed parallel beta-helix repeat-containing protein n=1 Tax=Paenibacillus sepulcri TaxID=359917 RepID=A0ABS7C7P8_9BACL|nr:right-handed parallel beta-helix repeat-containing protein [Paenibacillus sepulcri]
MPAEINVRTDAGYGAAGNGIADDTPAIQRALNDIDLDGRIIIPAGVYKLRKATSHFTTNDFTESTTDKLPCYYSLQIMRRCTIQATGAVFIINTSTTIEESYGAILGIGIEGINIIGGAVFGTVFPLNGYQVYRNGILLQNCDDAIIDGFQGMNLTQAVQIYSSVNCKVKNVRARNCYGSGIMVYKGSNNTVEDCFATNCWDGVISLFFTSTSTINRCHVSETRATGFAGGQGITVEHNSGSAVTNCIVEGFYYGIDVKNGSTGSIVKGNTLTNNLCQIAIRKGDPLNTQGVCTNVEISGNLIFDGKKDSGYAPILISDGGSGHVVKDNVVDEIPYLVAQNTTVTDTNNYSFTI